MEVLKSYTSSDQALIPLWGKSLRRKKMSLRKARISTGWLSAPGRGVGLGPAALSRYNFIAQVENISLRHIRLL